MPEEDKTTLRTREELMAKIGCVYGGRAAEGSGDEHMTNGASQDIQEATNIAGHGGYVWHEREIRMMALQCAQQ